MTASSKPSPMKEFVTEVLGIDGRGFRLMWDVLARPRKVFAAFLDNDQALYAAPIRVWLWVFGVKTLSLIFIGGAGGLFSKINEAQHGAGIEELLARMGVDFETFLALSNSWWNIFHPLLVLLLSIPAALCLAMLNRKATFSDHANIYLSAFLAASLATLVITPFVVIAAPSALGALGVANAVVFGMTFARGGGAVPYFKTRTGAVLKTIFVSLVFFLSTIIASMILLFALMAYAKAIS